MTLPLTKSLRRLLALLVLIMPFMAAAAQPADPAGDIADQAVTDWLARQPITVESLQGLGAADVCQLIPSLLVSPPPPAGTSVNLDDRMELEPEQEGTRTFTYSGSGSNGMLHVIQVTLRESGDSWVPEYVGFRLQPPSGIRAWLQTPPAGWAFAALSLVLVVLLATPGPLRRWLGMAGGVIRQHRGTYIFTIVLMFGIFGLGLFSGSQLPEECTAAVIDTVTNAVTLVGATEAYGSGSVLRAAVVTFHQNFIVVTVSVLTSLALIFGLPAYVFAGFSFFVQAIPFGMVGSLMGPELLFVVALLLLELSAYFTVVAGGGFLLVTLIRGGISALPQAIGKLFLMLPIAMILLVAGAWFEAWVLVGIG